MRKNMLLNSICVVTFFFAFSALAAEPGILKELDSHMESTEDAEKKKRGQPLDKKDDLLDQIGKHFNGDLRLRGSHFIDSVPDTILDISTGLDKSDNTGELLFNCSTWVEKDFWSLHTAGWIELGTQDDTYRGVSSFMRDKERFRRHMELNEIYLTLSAKNADLTLGKKIFENGISTIYSPANRYRSFDLNDPMDPKTFGAWQATLDYFVRDTTFTASVLPVFQTMKVPSVWSRWMVGNFGMYMPETLGVFDQFRYYFWEGSGIVRDLVENRFVVVEEKLPDNKLEDYGWFGRVKTSFTLLDIFLSAYHGPSIYPVIKIENRSGMLAIVKENPDVFNLAAGFSITWKNFEFHGEALYNKTDNQKDDTYINYVGGLTFSEQDLVRKLHLHKIDLTLEYARESIISDQDCRGYLISSRYARIGRNDVLAHARIDVTDDISLHYKADFNRLNRSSFQRAGVSYRLRSGLMLRLGAEFFDGPFDSYFGRWCDNDRIITTLQWSF